MRLTLTVLVGATLIGSGLSPQAPGVRLQTDAPGCGFRSRPEGLPLLPWLNLATGTLSESHRNVFLQHLERGEWTFATITRYNSWQDFASERTAAASAGDATGGWADIRQHSAFHRDTIADRIYPAR
jgi:hypothetical protein